MATISIVGPLRFASDDRQRAGRKLARQLSGWKRLSERRGLPSPHWTEAIVAALLCGGANRSERCACQWIRRHFRAHRAKLIDQPARKAARKAASHQIGDDCAAV